MFRTYFGDVSSGRIGRLKYLGHWILLCLAVIIVLVGITASVDFSRQIMEANAAAIQDSLTQRIGMPILWLLMLFALAVLFASLNIMAKRLRDMGVSGWGLVLVIAVISFVLTGYAPVEVASGFSILVFLALVLLPGRMTDRNAAA